MDPLRLGFGLMMLVTGGYFLHHHRSSRTMLAAARRWSSAEGQVVSSGVKRRGGSKPTWEPRVSYRFEADGRTHASDALTIGGVVAGARARAEQRVTSYPEGARVTVYYDPADPSRCCLERRHEGAWLEVLGGVFGIAVGTVLLVTGLG